MQIQPKSHFKKMTYFKTIKTAYIVGVNSTLFSFLTSQYF